MDVWTSPKYLTTPGALVKQTHLLIGVVVGPPRRSRLEEDTTAPLAPPSVFAIEATDAVASSLVSESSLMS